MPVQFYFLLQGLHFGDDGQHHSQVAFDILLSLFFPEQPEQFIFLFERKAHMMRDVIAGQLIIRFLEALLDIEEAVELTDRIDHLLHELPFPRPFDIIRIVDDSTAEQLVRYRFDQLQHPENLQPAGPDVHLAVVMDLYQFCDPDQGAHFTQSVVDDRWYAEWLLLGIAFVDQLFITRFEDMQIHRFPGVYHDAKRKHRNEIGHS